MVEVRATLEGLNAKLAAQRRDPALLAELEQVLRDGAEAAAQGRGDQLLALNSRFHEVLGTIAANSVLQEMMRSLRAHRRAVRAGQPVRARQNWDEHAQILQAVIAGDAERVTVLLHKPVGYVSGRAEDGYEPAAVLFAEENHWQDDPTCKRFAPWQRKNLGARRTPRDIDSTGLLVLTQDGRVARQLIGEDSTIEKRVPRVVWHAPQGRVERNVADVFRPKARQHGLSLDGVELKPAKVSWQNEEQLRFVLREGRKRQIRRMCRSASKWWA